MRTSRRFATALAVLALACTVPVASAAALPPPGDGGGGGGGGGGGPATTRPPGPPPVPTPRYRVTQSTVYWMALDQCDSDVEFETEWRVSRQMRRNDKSWEFNAPNMNIPTAEMALPDSSLSYELGPSQRIELAYQVVERDWLSDDLGQVRQVYLDPSLGNRSVILNYHDWSGCEAQLRMDITVTQL